MRTVLVWCLVALGAAGCAVSPVRDYDPASAYRKAFIQGFTVLFNPQVLGHQRAEDVQAELARQLEQISEAVPEPALAALRKVRIWVEWNKIQNAASHFHPSAGWLEQNGYNPEKAGDIEIANSPNFVDWSRAGQPCLLLHELAHAYHFRVLGERHAGIAAAYRLALKSKSYEAVEHVGGRKRRAYALINEKEYFAELSEAYFCKNDFYPFTRADLQKHDPGGYDLVQQLWNGLR
jgi:hypothetical protein